MIDLTERIESLKAGILAGVTATIAWLILQLIDPWLLGDVVSKNFSLAGGPVNTNFIWQSFFSGAIALISGFLFGVTYRYIVRQDDNVHLKSGAIAAFGLVQGLGAVNQGIWRNQGQIFQFNYIWSYSLQCLESLLIFAIAGLCLDWVIKKGLIKSFN
jgi:hypothetical protein